MNLRLGLYELAARYRLDGRALRRLQELAGLHEEPAAVARGLSRGLTLLAAALAGLGLLLWVAANWGELGRVARFALLQGTLLATGLGAAALPRARAPLGLLALLATGGLWAYFGQTYQTGADAWQLFALWAALTLPLCWAVRSDALWTPWAVVATVAIALWSDAHAGHRWGVQAQHLSVDLSAWLAGALLVGLLSPAGQRRTGAGVWSLRTAVTLLVPQITLPATAGLFAPQLAPQYLLGLLLLAALAGVFARVTFDVFALSAVALGIDGLLLSGLAHLLFDHPQRGEPIDELLVLSLVAAGLLAATVKAILQLARRHAAAPQEVA